MATIETLLSFGPLSLLRPQTNFRIASETAINLIIEHEGFMSIAYPDPGSRDGYPWTIGFGHTKGVKPNDRCTKDQAIDWLYEDVDERGAQINKLVKTQLNQNQFDALCSFVFNIGVKQFKKSTMLKLLNKNKMIEAANEFAKWCRNDGKVMRGLVIRRKKEARLFLSQEMPVV